jgi:hypothetical protein
MTTPAGTAVVIAARSSPDSPNPPPDPGPDPESIAVLPRAMRIE